jgi:flagellar protein FlbD
VKGQLVILLTKLDQQKILINLETVKYIESVPDTIIFFTNGESLMVQESIDAISQAVVEYQAAVFRQSTQSPATSP